MTKKHLLDLPRLLALLLITSLAACGGSGSNDGGSGSNDPDPAPTAPVEDDAPPTPVEDDIDDPEVGVFTHGVIGNIGYRTETHEGVTNAAGEYDFEPGEMVTFFIGDLEFPPVMGSGIDDPESWPDSVVTSGMVTLVHIVGTTDTTDNRVINTLRLLLTLDTDGDPVNGITISDTAKDIATPVDFDVPPEEFVYSPAPQTIAFNAGQNTVPGQMVSAEEARKKFESYLKAFIPFWMTSISWELYQAVATVTVEGFNHEFGAYGLNFAGKDLPGDSLFPERPIDTSYVASCSHITNFEYGGSALVDIDDPSGVFADFHARQNRNLYDGFSVWTAETTAYMGLALIDSGEEWMISERDALTTTLVYYPGSFGFREHYTRTIALVAEASENFSARRSDGDVQVKCLFSRRADVDFWSRPTAGGD